MTSKLDSSAGDELRKREYNKEFAPTMIAYGLSSWAAAAWGNLDGDSPTRFLSAALPLIPAVALVVVYVRHHRRLDDYQRLLQFKGLAMGFGVAMFASVVFGWMAMAGLEIPGSHWYVFAAGMVAWSLGIWWAGRR